MSPDKPISHLTKCGIPGINRVPFGIHVCHFYRSRQDLVDALVPYFVAGLRNNESCLWITASPFSTDDAKAALVGVLTGADAMIGKGQMRILDARTWRAGIEGTNASDVVKFWLHEEEKALAEGHQGLRSAVNTSFLSPEDWDTFMEYEGAVSNAVRDRRILMLCSYDAHQCQATSILEIVRNHQYTLDRRDADWEILGQGPVLLRYRSVQPFLRSPLLRTL
jgi:hypothetical protein